MKATTVDCNRKHRAGTDQRLESEASPDSVVRLWVKRSTSTSPDSYMPLLEKLLRYHTAFGSGRGIPRYRFLGVRREPAAGADYLCMSFSVERNRAHSGISGKRIKVDE